MTVRYVGIGGSDANNGLTWATRKLTLNGCEDTPVVAGDIVYVGAGTYRELLTVDVSGGNVITGSASVTVSVTQGSPIVIGNGTTWLSNTAPDYIFQTPVLASGFDGVTTLATGTSHTFSSAAGNFQAGHVGYTIRINTIGAYVITAVGGATSITVAKPDNSSFVMTAGTGLNYNVGPEPPCDILSVDSDTQITLKKPWGAPSFTGLQFITYNPIRYIADYLGTSTDGVGGVVRVTGSDNDQTITRASCITATAKNYRTFQNFQFDLVSAIMVTLLSSCADWVMTNCKFMHGSSTLFTSAGATQARNTIQNCMFLTNRATATIIFTHTSVVNNAAHVVQNCIILGGSGNNAVTFTRVGGNTVKNCVFSSTSVGVAVGTALTVGQAITANNNILFACGTALSGTVTGEVIEDNNNLFGNNINRANTATGANSNTFPPLFDARWFFQLVYAGAGPYNPTQMVTPFDLSAASQIINLAGVNPSGADMRGTSIQQSQREWGALEYDPTLSIKARQASSIDGGGMVV